jgi:CHAT domain-containing protein
VISEFPDEFLTNESDVVEEFAAQPQAAASSRGQLAAPGALDFSYDLQAGEAAILALRHPSGALTFHLPALSTSRGARQPNQVRFVVTVRSTDVATGTRGLASKAVKAILIKVGKAAADKVVSLVLPKLAAAFEKSTWEKAGLHEGWLKVTKETLAKAVDGNKAPLEAGVPTSPDRTLLLIHGTFSNAASAYKSLAASDFFDRVKPIYGDRVFAFDHFTVSRTPEENARMLLEGLPAQTTTFDVVTHSRGGLVLRNLVERAQVFGPLAQRFHLGRAVLVASPNQGTPLATPQRWADTVGWIANLLELFPDNPFTTGAAFVANGLVWIAGHASGDLPGLHSMDGSGDMIAELQRPPDPPANAYSALVANYNPTDLVLARMLDTGVDQFFGSANDLVVPSEGGWRVAQSGRALIPGSRIGCYGPGGNLPADTVTHIDFFSHRETVDFLVCALSDKPQPLPRVDPASALPDRSLLREGAAAFAASAAAGSRVPTVQPTSLQKTGREPVIAPKPAQPPLKIIVVNGNLAFEREALLLGHYRASRLTGTEEAVDRLVGCSMSRSLAVGLYPLEPGTQQIFLNTQINRESPQRMPRPKAVIVAGLGEEGKLDAAGLIYTVRQAVIAWAQRTTELDRRAPAVLDLAATLLASGGTGVNAGQAAQRIAQAVYEANQLLAHDKGDGKGWPRVGQLRLIELYLDRASEAWRALKLHAEATPDRYEIADEVAVGTGPLPRPSESGYRGANYDFITAETDGDEITYTLDTKRARSEVRGQQSHGKLLRDLVSTASTALNQDPQIGRTLFKLLVPIEMEAFFSGSGELQIELDAGTAGIPWELLDDDDEQPWAIRTKLLRKLRTENFRQQVRDADLEASALVIGEPECPAIYPRLPAAREEALAVLEFLRRPDILGEKAEGLISDDTAKPGPDARAVVNALLERPWRMVHIAGHGELQAENRTAGGVVLSNGAFLGASVIRAMRVVPELVFVNCCHLAARDINQLVGAERPQMRDRVRFAAGVAEELINIGVRCVIAAGWAVNDVAASTFATRFYDALLHGCRFIDAVADARQAAFSRDDNTWAAYQCYGDPNWYFRGSSAESGASKVECEDEFGVPSEMALKLTLETIIVQTKFQNYNPKTQLARVQSLEKRFTPKWGKSGCVAEFFGAAYAEVKSTESAIRWYEKAVNSEDGEASLRAAEQLANLRARLAWETVENARNERDQIARQQRETSDAKVAANAKGTTAKAKTAGKRSLAAADRKLRATIISARQSVEAATVLLDKLIAVNPTMERESLYGSACKRLALIEAAAGKRAEERKAVEAMNLHYQRAAAIGRDTNSPTVFYPAINSLAAEAWLNAGRRERKGLEKSVVELAQTSLEKKNATDPDFWSVVGQTEIQLYQSLASGKLATSRGSLEKRYLDLHRRVSASWMWSSVYDTTQFALRPYQARASAKECTAAETLLEYLRKYAQPQ